MYGGKNKHLGGYTIVELMVVLAVSGLMFLIATLFINGRVQEASFKSSVNTMTSNIQDIIDQVGSGKYSDQPLYCTAGGAPTYMLQLPPYSTSPTGQPLMQGTNSDCVFMGKFIYFGGGTAGDYQAITLAGATENTTISNVIPVTPTANGGGGYDLTTQGEIPQGLTLNDISVNGNKGYYGFGFSANPQNLSNSVSKVTTALTEILVYAPSVKGPNLNITGLLSANNSLQQANTVSVCVTDGQYYANILIGQNSSNNQENQLVATPQELGTNPC
ncbi:MAG TPA: prepilin-type N-terminal cleavage/methylation domain-containing protein [Candidatus Sulfotelmatobacter sp.]|nr:prepilin-type N-terminal cleavage/methylation domain-containing protein [Candidatus Sulfotelmatobacter sp.]